MSSAQRATTGDCLTAKALGTRMGVSRKRVRAILRADCPGEAKAKAWDIPAALAKDVQSKYKAKAEEGEGKRKTVVKKESMTQRYLQSLNADDAANAHSRFSPLDNLRSK